VDENAGPLIPENLLRLLSVCIVGMSLRRPNPIRNIAASIVLRGQGRKGHNGRTGKSEGFQGGRLLSAKVVIAILNRSTLAMFTARQPATVTHIENECEKQQTVLQSAPEPACTARKSSFLAHANQWRNFVQTSAEGDTRLLNVRRKEKS